MNQVSKEQETATGWIRETLPIRLQPVESPEDRSFAEMIESICTLGLQIWKNRKQPEILTTTDAVHDIILINGIDREIIGIDCRNLLNDRSRVAIQVWKPTGQGDPYQAEPYQRIGAIESSSDIYEDFGTPRVNLRTPDVTLESLIEMEQILRVAYLTTPFHS